MSAEHKPHQERPLHDYIDMEAYDVVAGETHRALLERYSDLYVAAQEVANQPFGSIDQRAFYRLREVLGA